MSSNYQTRLETVEELVSDRRDDVGSRTGVPFIVYPYPPNRELAVDEEVESTVRKLRFQGQDVASIDIRDLVFSILDDDGIIDAVIDQERTDRDRLLKGLKSSLLGSQKPGRLANRILDQAANADTVFLYRTGILYPFASASTLMGQLEGRVPTADDGVPVPVVVCYPATVDENTLHFLNETEGTYYRARVIQ